jgi:hypothetical protein
MPSVTSGTPDDPLDADPIHEELVWRRNLFAAIAALLFVVVVAAGGLDVATSVREDRTFSVGAAPRLIVHDGVGGGRRGRIEVRAGDAGHIRVEGKVHGTWRVQYVLEQRGDDVMTTNGAIMLDAELQPGARHRAETTNGAVTVHLRGEPSLRVSARTTNGAVVANRPVVSRERSADALSGTIGAGEGELSLRTTNGRITIE